MYNGWEKIIRMKVECCFFGNIASCSIDSCVMLLTSQHNTKSGWKHNEVCACDARSWVSCFIQDHSKMLLFITRRLDTLLGWDWIYFPGGPYDDWGLAGAPPKSAPLDEKSPPIEPALAPELSYEPPAYPEPAPPDSFCVLYLMK